MECINLESIGLVILVLVIGYWSTGLILNDRGTEKLSDFRLTINQRLKAVGASLEEIPAHRDASPCEIKWHLTGNSTDIIARGGKMYRIVKRFMKDGYLPKATYGQPKPEKF